MSAVIKPDTVETGSQHCGKPAARHLVRSLHKTELPWLPRDAERTAHTLKPVLACFRRTRTQVMNWAPLTTPDTLTNSFAGESP